MQEKRVYEQPDGRFLKSIRFKFPVFFNGEEVGVLSWDKENTVESVARLKRVCNK